jgi:hypothetical protein
MGLVLGLNAKLYIDEESGYVTPDWSEVSNCKDLTQNLEKNDADVTVRGNNGWRAHVGVLKDGGLEFKMLWDTSDPNFLIILNAFLARAAPLDSVNVAALDGDILTPGSQGLHSIMIVTTFTRNEPLEEALDVDVKLMPTYFPAQPTEWMIVH